MRLGDFGGQFGDDVDRVRRASETVTPLLSAPLEAEIAVITPEQAFRDCIATWRASQRPRRRAPLDRAQLGPNMLLTLGQMHVQESVWQQKRFG